MCKQSWGFKILEGVLLGLSTALTLQNLLMAVAGCLIGMFIGMLPGLGPVSIIAIMITVAINIGESSTALIMLAGVYYSAIISCLIISLNGVLRTDGGRPLRHCSVRRHR